MPKDYTRIDPKDETWDEGLLEVAISLMLDAFQGGDWPLAKQHYEEYIKSLEHEDHVEVWARLDSRQRAYLKGEDRKYLRDEN